MLGFRSEQDHEPRQRRRRSNGTDPDSPGVSPIQQNHYRFVELSEQAPAKLVIGYWGSEDSGDILPPNQMGRLNAEPLKPCTVRPQRGHRDVAEPESKTGRDAI